MSQRNEVASTPLGTSIQTAEIDDDQVTKDKVSSTDVVPGLNELLESDTTGGTTTNTSLTQVGDTLTVEAGAVESHVIIVIEYTSIVEVPSTGSGTSNDIQIRVDDNAKKLFRIRHGYDTNVTGSVEEIEGTFVFYYSPSASEKTNGFTVKIYALAGGAGGSRLSGTETVRVFGA